MSLVPGALNPHRRGTHHAPRAARALPTAELLPADRRKRAERPAAYASSSSFPGGARPVRDARRFPRSGEHRQ